MIIAVAGGMEEYGAPSTAAFHFVINNTNLD